MTRVNTEIQEISLQTTTVENVSAQVIAGLELRRQKGFKKGCLEQCS